MTLYTLISENFFFISENVENQKKPLAKKVYRLRLRQFITKLRVKCRGVKAIIHFYPQAKKPLKKTPEESMYVFAEKSTSTRAVYVSIVKNVEQKIYDKFYRPIDIYYQHGDSSELVDLTNWKPEISIEQTLEDLLKYWLNKIN